MTVLQIRYSLTTGNVPSGLVDGQLAINLADSILYWIDNTGALKNFNFASPVAPTMGGSDNSTHVANTTFVQGLISALVGTAPLTLNTLAEIAAAINNDPNFFQTINNVLVNCIRFDIAQGLNGAALVQAQANIGLPSAIIDGGTF